MTNNQIHDVDETPKSIANQWYDRGCQGSPVHNSRAVINRYPGSWDANPATLTVELSYATLTNVEGFQADDVDLRGA